MAKDPAFLFYPSDFLTGTMFMNNEQIGIYIKLLCSQHQHGGIIEKISFNSLVGNNDIIRVKFIETENGFYNIRLMEVMGVRNTKSNNLSIAAKKTWEDRKNTIAPKKDTIVLQSYNNSNTKVKKKNTIAIQPVIVNEVIIYFKENGYKEDIAIKAFNYYNEANWHDASGKKVLNWKQKMQSVWFKPENKELPKPKQLTQAELNEEKKREFMSRL
jgi:uncharacterized protein YdaU (DUF1376 family)